MSGLFQNVLRASFHGSIIIAAVLLLRLALRKAPKKYICILWLLAFARLLMPFSIESSLSLQPEPEQVAELQWQQPTGESLRQGLTGIQEGTDYVIPAQEDSTITHTDTVRPAFQSGTDTAETVSASVPAQEPAQIPAATDWAGLLSVLWAAALGVIAACSVLSYLRLKYLVREAVKIPGGWECDRIETAFILGFIRPRIYLPMGMTAANRRYILAHERTHLRKGDHWFKLLAYIAVAIHWFNPLAWIAYLLLCRDMEMACDERVVQDMDVQERKRYSAALLSCSTNRIHYAGCPVAFGEVSVRQRIVSVLHYRKPGFWISLASVAAIAFVAVFLLTTPRGDETLAVQETVPETTAQEGYASSLRENEIPYICAQAIERIKAQDSYYITGLSAAVSTDPNGSYTYRSEIRRSGADSLRDYYEQQEDGSFLRSYFCSLICDGREAYYTGLCWTWYPDGQGSSAPGDSWLDPYSLQEMTVSFPEGTGVISGDTVSMHYLWEREDDNQEGTLTFTFLADGSLASFGREYTEESRSGSTTYTVHYTVMEEDAAQTSRVIRQIAEEVMTAEEYDAYYEAYLLDMDTVTQVPSNKTYYDLNYVLGADSYQWKFGGDDYHVRIGAVDYDENGLTLQYSEADDSHTALTAERGFWLEELVDGAWTVRGEWDADVRSISVTWTTTDSYALSWPEPLDAGFYRVGRYHTMTLPSGESERAVCYAKFRLYNAADQELIRTASSAFDGLLARDSYHLYFTHWISREMEQTDYDYRTAEIWKSSQDYLEDMQYHLDSSTALWRRVGEMLRGGSAYSLEWTGDTATSPISSWESNDYVEEATFQSWTMYFQWYEDAEAVFREGNSIYIQLALSGVPYEACQTELTFDDSGSLIALRRLYLPTRDCTADEKVETAQLIVYDDAPSQIAQVIQGQDLSVLPSFSWAEEQALYSTGDNGVRTTNFANATAATMSSTGAVIDRALRDCTLPTSAGLEPGTNVAQAFYDEEARMWKVEFTATWDSSVYQAVYMDASGITRMTVQR